MSSNRSPEKFSKRRRPKNKVPDGWLDYKPLYRWVEDTRFLPFKCPLRSTILRNIDEHDRFSLDDLIDQLDRQGRKIGLIIDLTDTDRYYDYRDVEDRHIVYRKIRVPGHQDIPEHCCRKFFHVVHRFLRHNQTNNKLIGIHCTHGINRTGYFIIRYLIENEGFQPADAFKAFNQARGYPIEKYIDDLQSRRPQTVRIISSSSDTDTESDNSIRQTKLDRPLPYTRPSVDSSVNVSANSQSTQSISV